MSEGTNANPLLDKRLNLRLVVVVVDAVVVDAAAVVVVVATTLVGADILVDDIDPIVENSLFL